MHPVPSHEGQLVALRAVHPPYRLIGQSINRARMYLGGGTVGTYLPLPFVLARFRLHSTRVKCPTRNLNVCVCV